MLIKSEGIVLNCMLFSEKDLIVKILIKDIGLVSFLVKRGLKNKKKYFQQLTINYISFVYKGNKNLQYLKTIDLKSFHNKIFISNQKRNTVLFISEVISKCLKEGVSENYTYDFIKSSVEYLNTENCSGKYFDAWFVINFTKLIGIAPNYKDIKNSSDLFFDPVNGNFYVFNPNKQNNLWELGLSNLLIKFLSINVEDLENFYLSYDEHLSLIEKMLKYYSNHIPNFNHEKLMSVYSELL